MNRYFTTTRLYPNQYRLLRTQLINALYLYITICCETSLKLLIALDNTNNHT